MFSASQLDAFLGGVIQESQALQEVEVDLPALMNSLARYPGQFDVLRELIQNADDAAASTVEIHFETDEVEDSESQPAAEVRGINKLNIRKWIFKNEGSFKPEDWRRLGRIAAGDGDSTKVGAFGVGFYSVPSKSDRPLVRSNGTSSRSCKTDGKDAWTSVELELQTPEPLPALDDLSNFLVSSQKASVHTQRVFRSTRWHTHPAASESGDPAVVESILLFMIDGTEWAFPSRSHMTCMQQRPPLFSGMRKGVESIMKTLPSSFKCKGFNSEQHGSFARISKSHSSKAHLFSGSNGIIPEDNNGHLFVGQSTNQTTGIGLRISAHFLPTNGTWLD
ncbi:hypothetical protein V8E55_006727 [Tylopilus felleus]